MKKKITNKRCPETTLNNLIPCLWGALDIKDYKFTGFLSQRMSQKQLEKEMWDKWLSK